MLVQWTDNPGNRSYVSIGQIYEDDRIYRGQFRSRQQAIPEEHEVNEIAFRRSFGGEARGREVYEDDRNNITYPKYQARSRSSHR